VITVRGLEALDRETVIAAAGLRTGVNLFRLNLRGGLRGLCALPRVASATLRRVWPNGVDIVLQERTGLVLLPCGEGWVEVAGDGVALEIHSSAAGPGLPVLEGIEPATIAVGQRVPTAAAQTALMGLGAIQQADEEISSAILAAEGLQVTVPDGTVLYLGPPDVGLITRVNDAVRYLKSFRSRGLSLEYIDVRLPGQPVIKPR
jgi:cell division protein FtsQ